MFVVEGKVERRQFFHSPNNDDEFFTTKQDTQVLYRHTHTHNALTQTQKALMHRHTPRKSIQINDFSTHNVSWKKN